ncbi:MAG: hypothetical protein CM15mP60_0710 [Alphaproteobacteria bacterium]|nr:MAG: hypothetical protein CM15mP60_0710 [Alphaproteobacteria bacterium]
MDKNDAYILERQVGFVMRRAVQRHIAIFSALIPEMTPTHLPRWPSSANWDRHPRTSLAG